MSIAADTVHVVGLSASATSGGRTATGVGAVLAGAADHGATTSLLEVDDTNMAAAVAGLADADAVVFGSPVYRAGANARLRALLESTERGLRGERTAPLEGKAAAIVLTGASAHHFLAVQDLRAVLAGFFAVQVLSPGLYLDRADFDDGTTLANRPADLARLHGRALVDLASAVCASGALRALRPQV